MKKGDILVFSFGFRLFLLISTITSTTFHNLMIEK